MSVPRLPRRCRDLVRWDFTALEGSQVGDRGRGDLLEGLLGEERLVSGDEHVREGEQPAEDVIINDRVGQILKEQPGFFFVDVEAEIAELATLERVDGGDGVDQRTAAAGAMEASRDAT